MLTGSPKSSSTILKCKIQQCKIQPFPKRFCIAKFLFLFEKTRIRFIFIVLQEVFLRSLIDGLMGWIE